MLLLAPADCPSGDRSRSEPTPPAGVDRSRFFAHRHPNKGRAGSLARERHLPSPGHNGWVTGEVSDPLGWLSIGGFDVEPRGLTAAGVDWEQIEPVDVENKIDSNVAQALPPDGWRELELAGMPAPSHHWLLPTPDSGRSPTLQPGSGRPPGQRLWLLRAVTRTASASGPVTRLGTSPAGHPNAAPRSRSMIVRSQQLGVGSARRAVGTTRER